MPGVEGFSFVGHFEDGTDRERIAWQVGSAARAVPAFELQTVIRGVAFRGRDFDDLAPEDQSRAVAAGLRLSRDTGELGECVLSGDLPVAIVDDDGLRSPGVVSFDLDLHSSRRRAGGNLRLLTTVRGAQYDVADDWFEDGLLALGRPQRSDSPASRREEKLVVLAGRLAASARRLAG